MLYPPSETAFVLIDPYNDFLSPLGKARPLLRRVSRDVGLNANLAEALRLARSERMLVAFAPHQRHRPGVFMGRRFPHPSQILQSISRTFAEGSFGGRFHKDFQPQDGDIVASEHACSSGFTGTDLHARLAERGVTRLILAGLLSNTCVESTARSAVDLGYHVTLLSDCVATWSRRDHAAAVDHAYRRIGHAVLTLEGFRAALPSEGAIRA